MRSELRPGDEVITPGFHLHCHGRQRCLCWAPAGLSRLSSPAHLQSRPAVLEAAITPARKAINYVSLVMASRRFWCHHEIRRHVMAASSRIARRVSERPTRAAGSCNLSLMLRQLLPSKAPGLYGDRRRDLTMTIEAGQSIPANSLPWPGSPLIINCVGVNSRLDHDSAPVLLPKLARLDTELLPVRPWRTLWSLWPMQGIARPVVEASTERLGRSTESEQPRTRSSTGEAEQFRRPTCCGIIRFRSISSRRSADPAAPLPDRRSVGREVMSLQWSYLTSKTRTEGCRGCTFRRSRA